jgi:hypothetical protein
MSRIAVTMTAERQPSPKNLTCSGPKLLVAVRVDIEAEAKSPRAIPADDVDGEVRAQRGVLRRF